MAKHLTFTFDDIVDRWPGSDYIKPHWRNGPPYVIVSAIQAGGHLNLEVILGTFPHASLSRHGNHRLLIAPKFAAELSVWHQDEHGPDVVTAPLAAFSPEMLKLDASDAAHTLAAAFTSVRETTTTTFAGDYEIVEHLKLVGEAAMATRTPFGVALELAPRELMIGPGDKEQLITILEAVNT